jgi:hypothetical protein
MTIITVGSDSWEASRARKKWGVNRDNELRIVGMAFDG